MEAFFFGPSNKQVFATYHPASGGGGVVLTVICPPLFSDYILTHLVLRELAMALAERGQHVLRYHCSRDTAADLAFATGKIGSALVRPSDRAVG